MALSRFAPARCFGEIDTLYPRHMEVQDFTEQECTDHGRMLDQAQEYNLPFPTTSAIVYHYITMSTIGHVLDELHQITNLKIGETCGGRLPYACKLMEIGPSLDSLCIYT